MAYIQGNLALQPKKRPEQSEPPRERKKQVVIRRKAVSVQEKLLYLFTIAICVVVAGVIIFRYAQIYQMNLEIRSLTQSHEAMNVEIKELQKQVELLSDPELLRQKALQMGMVQAEEAINVFIEEPSRQTAMRE